MGRKNLGNETLGLVDAAADPVNEREIQFNGKRLRTKDSDGVRTLTSYVPRRTNSWDKLVGDFTTDGSWKVDGLDLSAIVPSEASAVHLRLYMRDDAANSQLTIRTNATDSVNEIWAAIQVANQFVETQAIIAIDADRKLDYLGSAVAFTNIYVAVLGWFI